MIQLHGAVKKPILRGGLSVFGVFTAPFFPHPSFLCTAAKF